MLNFVTFIFLPLRVIYRLLRLVIVALPGLFI